MWYIVLYYINHLFDDKFGIVRGPFNTIESMQVDVLCGSLATSREVVEISNDKEMGGTAGSTGYGGVVDHHIRRVLGHDRSQDRIHYVCTDGLTTKRVCLYRMTTLDQAIRDMHVLLPTTDMFILYIPHDYCLSATIISSIFRGTRPLILSTNCSDIFEYVRYNHQYTLTVVVYRGIERIFIIIFYLLLIIIIVLCFIIMQVWLRNKSTHNPLITPYELSRCAVGRYDTLDAQDRPFESCLICMDEFEAESVCRVLRCRHNFHKQCVDPWLKTKSSRCPYCRELIKMHDDHD